MGLGFAAYYTSSGGGQIQRPPQTLLLLSLLELAGRRGRTCPVPKWRGVRGGSNDTITHPCTHRPSDPVCQALSWALRMRQ